MSEQAVELRPPQFLDHVEELVHLPFFSDNEQALTARTDPNLLPPDVILPRVPLYIAGLRLLAGQRSGRAANEARAIKSIRGGLMVLDHGLRTPEVQELWAALEGMEPSEPAPYPIPTESKGYDPLPPWQLPAESVNSIVHITRGGVLGSLKHWGIVADKRKLGPHPPEVCVDWGTIRDLAGRRGCQEGIEIDWDKLPTGPRDKDPERIDYARELQLRFVSHRKLRGTPELQPFLPAPVRLPIAQPYHISRGMLRELMGGGFHFVDAYCKLHGMGFIELRRPPSRGAGSGHYMLLEEAAEIWHAYKSIPEATEADRTIISAAKEAEVDKKTFVERLTAFEVATIRTLRALNPKGRAIAHMPGVLAAAAIERVRKRTLPPYLLPMQAFERHIRVGYSMINKYLKASPHEPTELPLSTGHKVSCFDWGVLRELEERFGRRDDAIVLDWDLLPAGPEDLGREKIKLARYVQRLYVNDPAQVDTTPIEEWVEQQRHLLEITAQMMASLAISQAVEAPAAVVVGDPAAPEPDEGPSAALAPAQDLEVVPLSAPDHTADIPAVSPPAADDIKPVPRLPRELMPPAISPRRPPHPPMTEIGLTFDEILARTTADADTVQRVIADLQNSFRPPEKVTKGKRTYTIYPGPFAAAILMRLVGVSEEQIARAAGAPQDQIAQFVQQAGYRPNEAGRYNDAALFKAVVEFKKRRMTAQPADSDGAGL
jgi:hypothetical protein